MGQDESGRGRGLLEPARVSGFISNRDRGSGLRVRAFGDRDRVRGSGFGVYIHKYIHIYTYIHTYTHMRVPFIVFRSVFFVCRFGVQMTKPNNCLPYPTFTLVIWDYMV